MLGFLLMLRTNGVAQENVLIVNIKNINEEKGKIYVALYDSDANYLKNDAYRGSVNAVKGTVEIKFNNLLLGEYAIGVIHDVNGNEELDKNFLGIPKEGFGFKDGLMGAFGPPSFDKVKFKWEGKLMYVQVPLKYY